MRLVDADELMEHIGRDKLDSREAIMEMVKTAPTVLDSKELKLIALEREHYRQECERIKAQVRALTFAICNGVSGNEVTYEDY